MIQNMYNNNNNMEENRGSVLFKMPKNMRQIGQGDEIKRIYIEDYVMTYIKQLAQRSEVDRGYVIFLGNFVKTEQQYRNVFISAAIEVKGNTSNHIEFTNEIWSGIYEDVKTYFTDVEIVGWGMFGPSLPVMPNEGVKRLHIDNFAGADKVLFCYESLEREEIFYLFEEGSLKRQEGYYIYYEKNEEMQNYMLKQNEEGDLSELYDDKAVKEIRKIIASKKDTATKSMIKAPMGLLYGTGTLAAAIILVFGTAFLANYDRMRGMEKTLNVISKNLVEENVEQIEGEPKSIAKTENPPNEKTGTTKVETLPGTTTTIKEEDIVGDKDKIENSTEKEKKNDKTAEQKEESEGQEKEESGQTEKEQETGKENSQVNSNSKEEESKDTNLSQQEQEVKEEQEAKEEQEKKGEDRKENEIEQNSQTNQGNETEKNETEKSGQMEQNNEQSMETIHFELDNQVDISNIPDYHIVQAGDTLASISIQYYKTTAIVPEIKRINNIEDQDKILIGEKLNMPK